MFACDTMRDRFNNGLASESAQACACIDYARCRVPQTALNQPEYFAVSGHGLSAKFLPLFRLH